jgi:hypothetical protein
MEYTVKATLAGLLVAAATGTLSTDTAHASPILEQRCASDSLDPAQAKARLEWARACGDRINVKSPTNPIAPAQAYLTGTNSSNGIPLQEYVETDDFFGKNSFSGDAATVNQIFFQNQWRPSVPSASTQAGGFQRWDGQAVLALPRPTYPTYGNNSDINAATQLFTPPMTCTGTFPNDVCTVTNPNDCNLYTDAARTHVADTSVTGFYVNGFCVSSCYLPDQQIAFDGGTEGILDAMNQLRTGVTALTPTSTLDNITTHTDDVASYTHDIHEAKQVIFTITTRSGGQLKVTDKHPILEGDGRIVQARSIKVGNRLLKPDGTRDEVVSVTKTEYFGKVYNIKPVSTNRVANILIAQGFLVGSSRFQNDDVDFINRIILGHGIPENVIPH